MIVKITVSYIHDDVTQEMKVTYGYISILVRKQMYNRKRTMLKNEEKSGKIILSSNVNDLIY